MTKHANDGAKSTAFWNYATTPRNAINVWLTVATRPTIEAKGGEELDNGPQEIQYVTNGKRYKILPPVYKRAAEKGQS